MVTSAEKDGSGVATFSLNRNLNLDNATFGNKRIDKKGLSLGENAVILDAQGLKLFAAGETSSSPSLILSRNGLFINGGPSLTPDGVDTGGKVITQVGIGELQENGDNAATTGQLFKVNERLKDIENSLKGEDGSKTPKIEKSSSEKSKDVVTQQKSGSPPAREESLSLATSGDSWDATGKRLSNLGEGEIKADATDAVTGAQLFHVRENLQEKFHKDLVT